MPVLKYLSWNDNVYWSHVLLCIWIFFTSWTSFPDNFYSSWNNYLAGVFCCCSCVTFFLEVQYILLDFQFCPKRIVKGKMTWEQKHVSCSMYSQQHPQTHLSHALWHILHSVPAGTTKRQEHGFLADAHSWTVLLLELTLVNLSNTTSVPIIVSWAMRFFFDLSVELPAN